MSGVNQHCALFRSGIRFTNRHNIPKLCISCRIPAFDCRSLNVHFHRVEVVADELRYLRNMPVQMVVLAFLSRAAWFPRRVKVTEIYPPRFSMQYASMLW